jgi:hypothetical protein
MLLWLAITLLAASPEQLKAELLKADTDFALLTARQGLNGFIAYLTPDVLEFGEKGTLQTTKEQARDSLKRAFDNPGFQLRWEAAGRAGGGVGGPRATPGASMKPYRRAAGVIASLSGNARRTGRGR